jgi:hypothetical protein
MKKPWSRRKRMTKFPVSRNCPNCQGIDFKRVKPQSHIAFTDDRQCKNCGTRYTPPTPLWAALIFMVVGTLIILVNIFGIVIALSAGDLADRWRTGRFNFLTLPVGIGCLFYGIRWIRKQDHVPSTDDRKQHDQGEIMDNSPGSR